MNLSSLPGAAEASAGAAEPKRPPPPWEIEPGHKRSVFVVLRRPMPGFVQYLGADGRVKASSSNFRSREAAQAAIDRVSAKASDLVRGEAATR